MKTMRTILFKKAVFTIIAFCGFAVANSQQQADSLVQYLEMAVSNNPGVLEKYNDYQASIQKVNQAGGLNDPELSLGVFLSPMELLSGNQVADIRLMQMFPWFGVLKNAKDEMNMMAKASYASFLDSKLQVYYDVKSTWYELFKIQEGIRISEENIEFLHTIERVSLAKFKAGPSGGNGSSSPAGNTSARISQNSSQGSSGMQSMGGGQGGNTLAVSGSSPGNMQNSSMGGSAGGTGLADLYRIQIEIGDLENSLALLRNRQISATAKFNAYLNRPLTSSLRLPLNLSVDTLGMSILAVSDSILKNNPMLEMLKFEQKSLDARKTMVTRMSYPMVGLGVNYSVIRKNEMSTSAMNGSDMIMPMVTVTLPVYRKKYKAMQTETDFMKTASEQNYQSLANSLQTEYYEAFQLYQDAERRIRLYENQSLLARNTQDILIKSFSASGSELTEVLKVQQQTLEYEYKRIEAVTDFNIAIAWLKRLMAYSQIQ
jgi:outer membrane protein TolC